MEVIKCNSVIIIITMYIPSSGEILMNISCYLQ